MALCKSLQHRMRHAGMIAVAVVFLLQMFAVATMPAMAASAGDGTTVICTGTGMKTVSLSSLGLAPDKESGTPEQQAPCCGICALCSIAQDLAFAPPLPIVSSTTVTGLVVPAYRSASPAADAFPRTPQARAPPTPT